MVKMFITLLFLSLPTFLLAEDLKCSLSVSADPLMDVEFSVAPNSKVLFVNVADYRFYMTNKGHSKFELEVFDAFAPSRSYSTGYLRTTQDELSWAFWSRDVLLETTCKLAH